MKRSIIVIIMLSFLALYPPLKGQNSTIQFWQNNYPSILKSNDTITISFIGDIMQHTPQIRAAKSISGNYDYTESFRYLEQFFEASDYSVANMELTIGEPPYSGYPLFSSPPEITKQAQESGIDLFLMANNHIADKGKKGIQKTLDYYSELNVDKLGLYPDREREMTENPLIITIKGVKFALFNFTYDTNGMPVPSPYIVNLQDTTHIKEVIERAKKAKVDFIIALPHWGLEYHLEPSEYQRFIAEFMFSHGVDAIIGSHPHVPQRGEVNLKENKIVFYSLGNYVSNQSNPPYTQIGMMVQLRFVFNRFTKTKKMILPRWLYTYCFRGGELFDNYTVIPLSQPVTTIQETLGSPSPFEDLISGSPKFNNAMRTYKYILDKKLINIIND